MDAREPTALFTGPALEPAATMITNFTARRYRNVDVVDLPLGRVNLLIGANNAGKTNFLEALTFMGGVLQQGDANGPALQRVIEQHGGPRLVRRDAGDTVQLGWVGELPGALHAQHEISVQIPESGPFVGAPRVKHERVSLRSELGAHTLAQSWDASRPTASLLSEPGADRPVVVSGTTSFLTELGGLRSGVSQANPLLPGTILAISESFHALAVRYRSEAAWHCADFALDEARAPVEAASDIRHLDAHAAQVANALRHIEQTHPEGLSVIETPLRAVLPDLKRIWIKEGGGYRWVELVIGRQTYSLREMSHGTTRALLLALLLHTPERLSLLALDEPELNLHPAWLRIVGGWIQQRASADQLFISTHSPDLLDSFTEGFRAGDVRLLVFRQANEETVRAVQPAELDSFFQDGWELGDLYRVGEPLLGGWPW